ncbi:IS1/IS1595 family N-terminal zinc-binding domain-containing protein [Microcoleus sp. BR0-C5]
MESPCNESECKSTHLRKNTKKKGQQNHICVRCDRQFIADYESHAWLQ